MGNPCTGWPRFIPAWAGNAPPSSTPWPAATVHPRVGGERDLYDWDGWPCRGSSPRGRGTLFLEPIDSTS